MEEQATTASNETPPVMEPDKNAKQWAMLCHLIALVGLLGNGIGFILGPLVLWLLKKNDHPFIDEQGKESLNFQLTMLLALLICIPLAFIVIGVFLAIAVGVLMIIFPIIAAISANDGKPYRYPMTIRFIK